MKFFRQGAQGFGHRLQRHRLDGQLAGLGTEELAGKAGDVPHIHLLEDLVGVGPHLVAFHIDLDSARFVLQMEEGGLAEFAQGHDPPGHRLAPFLHRSLGIGVFFEDVDDPVLGLVVVGVEVDPQLREFLCLLPALFQDLVQFVHGCICSMYAL